MFEMLSVLDGPATSKRQLAALAAFFHLTVATVLLVGLAWRIESVEDPGFSKSFLPVAFLPAEWSAPLTTRAKSVADAPARKLPEIQQPETLPDSAPATLESQLSHLSQPSQLAAESISTLGAVDAAGSGAVHSGSTDAGGVGDGLGEAAPLAAIVWHRGLVAPKVLFRVDPVYPEIARRAHRQGAVLVEAEIGPDGNLRSARVISSALGFGLEQSALEAIGNWRFSPARYGERPVAVYYRWNILFTLR